LLPVFGVAVSCCTFARGWAGFLPLGVTSILTTSNVVVSQQKNKPGCGPVFFTFASQFFSLPQAGFFPKKKGQKNANFRPPDRRFQG